MSTTQKQIAAAKKVARGTMQKWFLAEILRSGEVLIADQYLRGKAKMYTKKYRDSQAAVMAALGATFQPGPRGGISGGKYVLTTASTPSTAASPSGPPSW